MKVGDQLTVTMEGFAVCLATVEEIESGKATIVIPATRVVMGVRMSLSELEPEVEHAMLGRVEPIIETKEAPKAVEL